MPDIELPDGSVASFPDDMSNAEIKAALRKQFPPPRPTSLAAGEAAQRTHAIVTFNAEFERYAVHDSGGGFRGFRKSLDAAIDFADRIQPPPPPRVKPKQRRPEAPVDPAQTAQQIAAAGRKAGSAVNASPNAGEAGIAIAERLDRTGTSL
jgi:hypothetical protein